MYGNGQVARQHVLQAATASNLRLNPEAIKLWLPACDRLGKGIYSIQKLVSYLERSSRPVRGSAKSTSR